MTWTYTGIPSSSEKDKVRFLCGDVDVTAQLVQDEEIEWVNSVYPSCRLAAAVVCEAIAARFSCAVDCTVGDISKKNSQKAEAFRKRAEELRNLEGNDALPFFGGLSKSGKRALDQNPDAVQPNFRIGLDDNPKAAQGKDNGDCLWDSCC